MPNDVIAIENATDLLPDKAASVGKSVEYKMITVLIVNISESFPGKPLQACG
jgi:hypothetical protein